MIKNLVAFGCSWTAGDALDDQDDDPMEGPYFKNAYPSLLAKRFNLTYRNFAESGGSLTAMQWSLDWWLSNTPESEIKESLVLVGLTEESRVSWFNKEYLKRNPTTYNDQKASRYIHSKIVDHDSSVLFDGGEWSQMHKNHYVLSDSEEFRQTQFSTTVRMFDGIAARYNIPMVQFNVLSSTVVNVDTFYNIDPLIKTFMTMPAKQFPEMYALDKFHPSKLGHITISKILLPRVNQVLRQHD